MTKSKVVIKINPGKSESVSRASEPKMVTEWHVGRIVAAISLLLIVPLIGYFLIFSGNEKQNNIDEYDREPRSSVNKLSTVEPEMDIAVNQQAIISTEAQTVPDDQENTLQAKEGIDERPVSSELADETIDTVKEVDQKILLKGQNFSHDHENKLSSKEVAITANRDVVKKAVISKILDRRISRALLASGINNKEPFGQIRSAIVADENKAISVFYFTEINNMKGQLLYHHWLLNGKTVFKRKLNILGNRWRGTTSKNISYTQKGHWQVKLIDVDGNILNVIAFDVI